MEIVFRNGERPHVRSVSKKKKMDRSRSEMARSKKEGRDNMRGEGDFKKRRNVQKWEPEKKLGEVDGCKGAHLLRPWGKSPGRKKRGAG